MTDTINVLIVGVGGQGTLFAGKVIGEVTEKSGLTVKQSEVHGMAQRGGSVVTYVRIGDQVISPLIEKAKRISLYPSSNWRHCGGLNF